MQRAVGLLIHENDLHCGRVHWTQFLVHQTRAWRTVLRDVLQVELFQADSGVDCVILLQVPRTEHDIVGVEFVVLVLPIDYVALLCLLTKQSLLVLSLQKAQVDLIINLDASDNKGPRILVKVRGNLRVASLLNLSV